LEGAKPISDGVRGGAPRAIAFCASKPLRIHFRDQKYDNFQKNAYIIVQKHASFKKKFRLGGGGKAPWPPLDPPVSLQHKAKGKPALVLISVLSEESCFV